MNVLVCVSNRRKIAFKDLFGLIVKLIALEKSTVHILRSRIRIRSLNWSEMIKYNKFDASIS